MRDTSRHRKLQAFDFLFGLSTLLAAAAAAARAAALGVGLGRSIGLEAKGRMEKYGCCSAFERYAEVSVMIEGFRDKALTFEDTSDNNYDSLSTSFAVNLFSGLSESIFNIKSSAGGY